MNPIDLQPWLGSLALLISIGSSVYLWMTTGSRDNTAAIRKLDERLSVAEQHLVTISTDMRHLPNKDGMQRMEITLAEMNGKIAVLSERLQPVAAISERLQEFMLERATK